MRQEALRARDLYRAVLLLALLGLVGLFFGQILQFLVVSFVALLLSLALAAGAKLLARLRLPRAVGVIATLFILFGAFVAMGYALVPPLIEQFGQFLGDLPRILAMLQEQIGPRASGGDPSATQGVIARLEREISGLLATLNYDPLALARDALGFLRTVLGVASVLIVLVVAAVYAAIEPRPIVEGFLRLFPRHGRDRTRALLADLRVTLTRWMWGTAVDMTTVGLMTGLALRLVGFEFPLLFGVLAGLLTIVPFFGPIAATVLVGLVALAEGWVHALVCVSALVVVQQIEGNVLVPLIMRRAILLHPAVIALGILFVGWTIGPLAILVAVPILATARVLIRHLWIERVSPTEEGRAGDGRPGSEEKPEGSSGGGPKGEQVRTGAHERAQGARRLP
ncbi:AI-2E family transporter [Rubrobacter marinus]|uniref:AI-2E family transporter n=1 Tax=Rubrobacter marinus TaxID=2653852 RepID=UPI00140AAADA|nr:AI-2E family transporter [Rubrobacter marinus]